MKDIARDRAMYFAARPAEEDIQFPEQRAHTAISIVSTDPSRGTENARAVITRR